MDAVSLDFAARARKNEQIVLRRLADTGLEPVANALKVDKSTISRLKDAAIAQVAGTMAALGLKVVPVEFKCYRSEDIEPLLKLAQQHMRRVTSVHDFAEDDPE